ncbi:ABC transporter permease [Xanthovirga aplysinae]|uniref:ABC transporter permease n=1 Tax=Xanthovirga aplysinae TaxID=2529853 RepID=UPI0012BC0EE6|nr:ABC transporter permease [Xanthovirga aplysinae]MTI33113.1 ABC transporter permease [Xanthovirga aplysinae]
MILFLSYLKFFIRHHLYHKGNALISAFSLILGISSTLFIFLYLQYQWGYDSWHRNSDRIYRVVLEGTMNGSTTKYASTGKPLGPSLMKDFGEVENYVSFHFSGKTTFKKGKEVFREQNVYAVNQDAFKIFDLPLIEGNPEKALSEPFQLVINQSLSQKYFGEEGSIGKELEINGEHYKVSGVMKDLPSNSHLAIDALISNKEALGPFSTQDWFDLENYTYVLLGKQTKADELSIKLKSFTRNHLTEVFEQSDMKVAFHLQPLKDAHFDSGLTMDKSVGNKSYLYIFFLVACLILFISTLNYINLGMAQSLTRNKEIGLRKTMGGNTGNLVRQLIAESSFMAFICLFASVALILYLFPFFKQVTSLESAGLWDLLHWQFLLSVFGIFCFITVLSGLYPVVYLSGFEPAQALKNKTSVPANIWLQKLLLTFQFSASIVLVICALILKNQMDYLYNKEMGFNKERVIMVDLPEDVSYNQNILRLKEELLNQSSIESASLAGYGSVPGVENGKDIAEVPDNTGRKTEKILNIFSWDEDFTDLLNIEIINGRNFSEAYARDLKNAALVNEQFVREFNWKDPLSKKVTLYGEERQIVGVVKNFHFTSLHNKIEPAVIIYRDVHMQKLLIKIQEDNLSQIESVWKANLPDQPFNFIYLDDFLHNQYKGDQQMMLLFTFFSGLAILLAILGLLGLSMFTVKQRIKEIGIRRVLGAGFTDIFLSVSKDFSKVILISIIISIPVSVYFASGLQNEFAYQAKTSLLPWFLTIFTVIALAGLTISYGVTKGIKINVIDTLRNE